jgi:hypothetical protein
VAVLPKPRRHLLSRDETAGIVLRVGLGLCAPFNSFYPVEITGKSDTLVPQSRLLSEKVCRTDRITVDIHQFAARFFAQAKARSELSDVWSLTIAAGGILKIAAVVTRSLGSICLPAH